MDRAMAAPRSTPVPDPRAASRTTRNQRAEELQESINARERIAAECTPAPDRQLLASSTLRANAPAFTPRRQASCRPDPPTRAPPPTFGPGPVSPA
eukprot:2696094-Heterocapsa_arctica.AAC.1